jgi:RNA polymerase sigma factor (sigma-70 family)
MPQTRSHAVLRYIRRLAGSSDSGDPTDGQLIARFCKNRDETAFAAIVDRHGPMVLNVCRRMLSDANEVDDAFQAVFLVLVRKARSIGKPSLLGNWLYGVACRTTANARRQAARRQSRTKEIVDMPATEPTPAEGWQELRPLLDEELARLPEKYRAPLVLCYLQGKTYTEAARILGWADGTVSGRLARGRTLLRARLVKRGLTLSTAALAAFLTQHAAQAAAVPATLASNTIKAALLVAAGNTLAATVSTQAAALTEGVLQAMFLTKLKIATAVVLALAVVGMGGGMFTYNTWAKEKGQVRNDAAPPKEKGESKPEVAAKAPAPAEDPKKAPAAEPAKPKGSREMLQTLATPVDYAGMADVKAKLSEVLAELATQYDFNFDINERAFDAEGIKDVLFTPVVADGRPLPRMTRVRLSTVLKKILSRIPNPSGATFVVRRDHIEITTHAALREELGLPANADLFPLVSASFDNLALAEALKDLSASSGFNIVLDSSKVEKKIDKPTITANFNNVPVDTAVRILAEMADLRAVLVDNVLFVTSKDAAERMQKEQEEKRQGRETENRGQPPPRM